MHLDHLDGNTDFIHSGAVAGKGKGRPVRAKTTLYMDPAFYKALRIAAIEDETSVTRLIEQIVREYLDRREKSRR